MANEIAKIEIDKETITSIIDKKVQAAILSELDGTKDLILSRVIDQLVNEKVDSEGNKSKWNHSSDITLLEFLVKRKIRQVLEQSLNKFFEKETPKLEEMLMKEITKNKNNMVKQMATSMIEASKSRYSWNFKIESEIKKQQDY